MEERCKLQNVVIETYFQQVFKVKVTQIDKVEVCVSSKNVWRDPNAEHSTFVTIPQQKVPAFKKIVMIVQHVWFSESHQYSVIVQWYV